MISADFHRSIFLKDPSLVFMFYGDSLRILRSEKPWLCNTANRKGCARGLCDLWTINFVLK